MPYRTGQDIGGLGRLAEAQRWVAGEKRADAANARQEQLFNLQMEANRANSAEIKRGTEFETQYMRAVSQSPAGKSYNAGHDWLDEYAKINPHDSDLINRARTELDTIQGKALERIGKYSEKGAVDLYNQSIGKRLGKEAIYTPDYDKEFSVRDLSTNAITNYRKNKDTGEYEEVLPGKTLDVRGGGDGAELKDKNLQVIHAISPKIENGTATASEISRYKLAEYDYTKEKVRTDPVTGQQTIEKPSLPAGFPSFKMQVTPGESIPKVDSLPEGSVDKATGLINIVPVGDLSKPTKQEIVKYRATEKSLKLMKQQATDLMNEIAKEDTRTIDLATIARRKSQYNDMLMNYKEILNLGVLNGPDLEIMERILKDPTSAVSMGLGKDVVVPSYKNVLKTIDRNMNYIAEATGGIVGEVTPTETDKPQTITVDYEGMDVQAKLADDGFYYVRRGDKYLKHIPEAQ